MPNCLPPSGAVPSLYHKVNTSPPLGGSEKKHWVEPTVSPLTPMWSIIHPFFFCIPANVVLPFPSAKACSLAYFIVFQKRSGEGEHISSLRDHSRSSQSRHSLPGPSSSCQDLTLQSLQQCLALPPSCRLCLECSFPQCPTVTVLLISQNPVPVPPFLFPLFIRA